MRWIYVLVCHNKYLSDFHSLEPRLEKVSSLDKPMFQMFVDYTVQCFLYVSEEAYEPP